MINLSQQEILRINKKNTFPLIYYDRDTSAKYWKVIIAIENYDVLSINNIDTLEILSSDKNEISLSTTKFNLVSEKKINESGVYRDMNNEVIETITLVFKERELQENIEQLQKNMNNLESKIANIKNNLNIENEKILLAIEFISYQMNTFAIRDNDSLYFKDLYPTWENSIGQTVEQGYKFTYQERLYKVIQQSLEIQSQYPPGQGTESLYTEINETNQGILEDPIPYNGNMELEKDKYYTQDNVIYLCTRNTEQPVYHNLKDLVNLYVTIVE